MKFKININININSLLLFLIIKKYTLKLSIKLFKS